METTVPIIWLTLVQAAVAFEWLRGGLEKFQRPNFMQSIDKTLVMFADKSKYGFYADFLRTVAVPRPVLFGNIVRVSELLAVCGLTVGNATLVWWPGLHSAACGLLALTLLMGALLNLNFYLAASWSNPSVSSINTLMGLTQLILGIFFISQIRLLAPLV